MADGERSGEGEGAGLMVLGSLAFRRISKDCDRDLSYFWVLVEGEITDCERRVAKGEHRGRRREGKRDQWRERKGR
jgi:hypothetical protein